MIRDPSRMLASKKTYYCWKSIAHHIECRLIMYIISIDLSTIMPEIAAKRGIRLGPNDHNHNNIEHFIGFAGHFNPQTIQSLGSNPLILDFSTVTFFNH